MSRKEGRKKKQDVFIITSDKRRDERWERNTDGYRKVGRTTEFTRGQVKQEGGTEGRTE